MTFPSHAPHVQCVLSFLYSIEHQHRVCTRARKPTLAHELRFCTQSLHSGYKTPSERRCIKETKIFLSHSLCCNGVYLLARRCTRSFALRVYTACELECDVRVKLEHRAAVSLRFVCTKNLYGVYARCKFWEDCLELIFFINYS